MGEPERVAIDTDVSLCPMCKRSFDAQDQMTEHLAVEHLEEIVAQIRED